MERLLVHHARLGDRDRFDYHAAYLVERPHSVVSELEALGVTCTRLGDGSGADPRWLRSLRSLVREECIDIVHAHSPQPGSMARPALRVCRSRPRLVYTEHNTWDCYGAATRLANLATFALDDAQFAVSAAAAASPPKVLARRVEVLTHGIDLESVRSSLPRRDGVRRELGVDDDTAVVTTVANFRREKAYDVLLDAASRVLESRRNVVFLSVGQGPLEEEMRRLHSDLGLGDRFRFLGFRTDVADLLAASDVFCLASRQEGLPVAFMEATALGIAPVVTAVGGLPDVIVDGQSGLLVEPEQPALLADALERVIADPELCARLAAGAASLAERFDARLSVRRQETVYAELVR